MRIYFRLCFFFLAEKVVCPLLFFSLSVSVSIPSRRARVSANANSNSEKKKNYIYVYRNTYYNESVGRAKNCRHSRQREPVVTDAENIIKYYDNLHGFFLIFCCFFFFFAH